MEWRHFAGMGFIGFGLAAIDGRIKNFIVSRWPKKSNVCIKEIKTVSGAVDDFSI
jgi:hypothetical protein